MSKELRDLLRKSLHDAQFDEEKLQELSEMFREYHLFTDMLIKHLLTKNNEKKLEDLKPF